MSFNHISRQRPSWGQGRAIWVKSISTLRTSSPTLPSWSAPKWTQLRYLPQSTSIVLSLLWPQSGWLNYHRGKVRTLYLAYCSPWISKIPSLSRFSRMSRGMRAARRQPSVPAMTAFHSSRNLLYWLLWIVGTPFAGSALTAKPRTLDRCYMHLFQLILNEIHRTLRFSPLFLKALFVLTYFTLTGHFLK